MTRHKKILSNTILWDNCLLWAHMLKDREEGLQKLIDSGVNVINIKINTPDNTMLSTIRAIAEVKSKWVDNEKVFLLKDADELSNDKCYLTFSLADSSIIEEPATDFDILSELGVKNVVLSAGKNFVGDSCFDPNDGGLGRYGRFFVEYSNQKDMLLDGSLGSYKTTMEAMEMVTKPFIFSHSNPMGVCFNKRNIKDEQIIACSKTGGVIGLTFLGGYLGDKKVSAELMFRNIDYIASLTSAKHVGFGSNYMLNPENFWTAMKALHVEKEICEGDCYQWSGMDDVAELMVNHGYSDEDIKGVLGLNWYRLFK